jgi:tetratricopeptide (TPR) repeat protein
MTATACLSGVALGLFVDGQGNDAADAAHIEACAVCARRAAALRAALAVDANDSDLGDEDAAVSELVAELVAVSPTDRPRVAALDRYGHAAIAQRFSGMAMNENRDLGKALDFAHVATVIASRIARRWTRSAEIEFEAWKNRATIHRERGEYDSARASLERARGAADACADRDLKRAVIQYADACICAARDVWQPAQAFALLDTCEPVFASLEPRRVRDTVTMRGVLRLHAGEYAAAHTAYMAALSLAAGAADPERADAMRNVVNSLARLDRLDEAESLLAEVEAIDAAHGRTLAMLRDAALSAEIAAGRGRYGDAARTYARLQVSFAECGEPESALIAGKERAVALVADGRISEAGAVLRDLVGQCVGSAERRRFTADALSYLRDLAERQDLSPDVAGKVSQYIDRIHVQRATPFVPPVSPFTM